VTTEKVDVVVVGIGSPDRGDDGVGPAVAAAVAGLGLPGVRVVTHAEPMDLLDDGLSAADVVVLVDAVRSGRPAGSLLVRDISVAALPEVGGAPSTHALGLDATVELARALRRMPRQLVLVGVEGLRFETGESLSPDVSAAVAEAAELVAGVVGDLTGGER
jgi:hydrogenase maturation protease